MRLRGKSETTFVQRIWGPFLGSTLLLAVILTSVVYGIIQLAHATVLTDDIRSKVVADVTATPSGSSLITAIAGYADLAPPAEVQPVATETDGTLLPLSGRRIGLDPGHGPRDDLGAILVDPATSDLLLSEAEFNLDVALRTRDLLLARGASVVLTRESADTFTAPWPADTNGDGEVGSYGDDLQQRVDILNDFQAEVFLSIHANGGIEYPPAEQDLQVLYCGTTDCAFPTENERLGRLVLDQLQSKLATVGGTAHGGLLLTDLEIDASEPPQHLFILGPVNLPLHVRSTAMPGVLAESLYVTSPSHAAQLNRDDVRQAIALAYADALQDYLTGDS